MDKRVVLVKPPERSFMNFGTFSLAVLSAAVRGLVDLSMLDATDLPVRKAVDEVWSRRPDIIGVTVMGSASVQPCAEFIRQVKGANNSPGKVGNRASIVAGGHGASAAPGGLLEAGADGVVIGEGELTFREIADKGIHAGAPGVACMVGDQMVMGSPRPLIRPLDRLSPPSRDLMPPPPGGIHLMETSRGCPHACAFCETTRFYGRRWRPHSPERVAAEINCLVEDHDAWIIHFADDNFAASPERVRRICDALRTQTLPACLMVSARADDLISDPNLLPAMAAARILRIAVGVETLDPGTAAAAGKAISSDTYQAAFRRMRELGIFSVASLIVGLPGESRTARERAVELAIEAAPDSAQFLPFLPLPGTPLAAGRSSLDPEPADLRDARKYNLAFFQHPTVKARLKAAAAGDGIRGLLARATLKKRSGKSGALAPAV